MDKLISYKQEPYRPLSNSSLITQILLLNLIDALLTLYATLVGVGELNPIMRIVLNYGPLTFVTTKVLVVTVCTLGIKKILGHSGRHLYLLFAAFYWFILLWHIFGIIMLWEVETV